MARNMQPIAKRCKALNLSPAVMGYDKKTTNRNPKGQMRRKQSEYAMQLTEKQKVKFVYGIMEKQFHMYYEKANRMQGKTGENLLTLIERRLDNVVYRLGFAKTRREARQLTTHGHFTVNGQRVDIPSYLVKVGDVIEVREKSRASVKFKGLVGEDAPMVTIPKWLSAPRIPSRARSLLSPSGTTSTSPWKSTSSSSCTLSKKSSLWAFGLSEGPGASFLRGGLPCGCALLKLDLDNPQILVS